MTKRPLTVSVRTPEGKELKSGTVEDALNGNLSSGDESPPVDDVSVVIPIKVAVEVVEDASN